VKSVEVDQGDQIGQFFANGAIVSFRVVFQKLQKWRKFVAFNFPRFFSQTHLVTLKTTLPKKAFAKSVSGDFRKL
jgi:hypothetical protein